MKVRLIRKLADQLDGVDVSRHTQGDVIELPPRDAQLLLAEGWAALIAPPDRSQVRRRLSSTAIFPYAEAAETTNRHTVERLRAVREEMEKRELDRVERRRAEDLIREELHDSQAKTIRGKS